MGATSQYTDLLIDAGIIRPIADVAFVGEPPLFSLPEVQRAINSFQSGFRTTKEEPLTLVDLGTAAMRTKIPLGSILKLLADRQVEDVAILEGKAFFNSIRVSTHELVAAATGAYDWIAPEDAAKQLGLKNNSIRPLLASRYLASHDFVRSGIEFGRKFVVRQSEVDRFKSVYASVSEVKALTHCRSRHAIAKLGIKPAVSIEVHAKSSTWVVFYERAKLPGA